MANVQVRLPDDLQAEIDELARELTATRSEAIRALLLEGVGSLRQRRALERYAAGDFSLERGARYARLSLHRFAQLAADRGIPYFRYGPEEAEAEGPSVRRLFPRKP